MSITRKADFVLNKAKEVASKVNTWADFSCQLFDQRLGIVSQTFKTDIEKQAFYDSEQYKAIQGILTSLMRSTGIKNGSTPQDKSGRFVVRLPKTIHHNLEIEAKREGVSLNQLSVAKLSLPLPRKTDAEHSIVLDTFNQVHGGYSPDWLIIDPHYNELFLSKCRRNGLADTISDYQLNHMLLNIRKAPRYKGLLNATTQPSGFQNYDDCIFAAEIAVGTIQREDGVTLDRILCDPDLRSKYDTIAMKMVSNVTAIKLRSAAFNLRKTRKLFRVGATPSRIELRYAGPLRLLNIRTVESDPGAYVIYDQNRPLFAGETDNLNKRINVHQHGGLPDWVKESDSDLITLKYSAQPEIKKESRLIWLSTFINQEKPLLNFQAA